MSNEKLSELSKPVAWVMSDDLTDKSIISTPAYPQKDDAEGRTVGTLAELYSQEYVSALDEVAQYWIGRSAEWKLRAEAAEQRIAELESIATDYAGKFQKAQDAAKHLIIMNDSAQAEIAHLKALLATPVRLPDIRSDDYHETGWFQHMKYYRDVERSLRAAGFTVGMSSYGVFRASCNSSHQGGKRYYCCEN